MYDGVFFTSLDFTYLDMKVKAGGTRVSIRHTLQSHVVSLHGWRIWDDLQDELLCGVCAVKKKKKKSRFSDWAPPRLSGRPSSNSAPRYWLWPRIKRSGDEDGWITAIIGGTRANDPFKALQFPLLLKQTLSRISFLIRNEIPLWTEVSR